MRVRVPQAGHAVGLPAGQGGRRHGGASAQVVRGATQLSAAVPRSSSSRELPMRRVRYAVAVSLDGYIAGPRGEADWIITDPDIDVGALVAQFDTFLIGRRTFEVMTGGKKKAGGPGKKGMKTFVFSRTLRQRDYPKLTIVAENAAETVAGLRAEEGKDIWLFGGGSLFRSLL